MISIIICSVNPVDLQLVRKNIEKTVGVPFELIAFDNRTTKWGICKVYNQGIHQAKYDMLCFMHEDIEIQTTNWGEKIMHIFNAHPEIGIAGVAGGGYKALAPSGWYCLEFENPHISFQNIIQGYKSSDRDDVHAYHNPYNESLADVVCVDGVWLCVRKSIAQRTMFDEKLLTGFHGYDIDFCLGVFGRERIVVTYDILMRHSSEGNFNKAWLDEILKVHKKWNAYLPLTTSKVSETEIYFTEKRALKKVIEQMREWKYTFRQIQRILLNTISSRRMPIRLFFKGYIHLLKETWKS